MTVFYRRWAVRSLLLANTRTGYLKSAIFPCFSVCCEVSFKFNMNRHRRKELMWNVIFVYSPDYIPHRQMRRRAIAYITASRKPEWQITHFVFHVSNRQIKLLHRWDYDCSDFGSCILLYWDVTIYSNVADPSVFSTAKIVFLFKLLIPNNKWLWILTIRDMNRLIVADVFYCLWILLQIRYVIELLFNLKQCYHIMYNN